MLKNRLSLATTIVLACGTTIAAAAPGTLRLKAGDIDLAAAPDLRENGRLTVEVPRRVVIQLDSVMDEDRRAEIEATGARILDYIPDNAFVLDLRRARMNAVSALPFVQSVVAFDRAWKIDPELGTRQVANAEFRSMRSQGLIPAHVMLFPGANVQRAIAQVSAAQGVNLVRSELTGDRFLFQVTGSLAALQSLADIDSVQWIEHAPEIQFRNASTNWVIQSNVNGQTPIWDQGLHGEGQLVAVMDGRVDINHCSFRDTVNPIGDNHRKIHRYNDPTSGFDFHGTHVAGTVLGNNGVNNDTRGIAYEARLIFDSTPSFSFAAMNNRLNTHYGQGATIHTNSWGNDFTTAYDGLARAIDNFSWANDDNLVIFAVTNGSNLRNPENAKNCLAVGATNDANSQNSHCTGGVGTTSDGRRKPEIYAPGCGTRSAAVNSSCSTSSLSGTSMAAPAIAGASALTRQYYMEGFYPTGTAVPADGFTPSGTLMKATLLNSTVDMTGVAGYPSNLEGWGRLLLDNSLYFDGDTRFNIIRDVRNSSGDALSTGDVIEIPFTVNSNSEELRITLVWHDAPAAVNSSFTPVNNLDLEMDGLFGSQFLGNVFAGGFSNIGGSADIRNNVEMIRMASPFPGDYVARIRATGVNEGSQGYAIVITGDVAEDILPGCSEADLAEPYGTLNFFDLGAYLTAFNAQDPSADLAAPEGVFNFFDLGEFLTIFNQGCP